MASDGMYTDTTRPATVSTFRLDRYEVTVGRFRQFVNAGYGTQQNPPAAGAGGRTLNGTANQGGWDPTWNTSLAADTTALVAALECNATYQTWTDAPGSNENRPIVCITWYEAMAFCAWDGGFLPTEAEWHYAASGGSLQRAYPWSSPAGDTTLDCSRANFGGPSWPTTACIAAGTNNVGATSPAGDGAWGQSDLGGNAWEWVLDWYATPYPSPCNDCANLFAASYRVSRGGGFSNGASYLRAGYRSGDGSASRIRNVSVRCARTP
jgi:formylglycine-generating enzyme required for sulfatase activity